MATYKNLKSPDGDKLQVESAIRDGAGKNIENNYAKQNGFYSGMGVGKATVADNLTPYSEDSGVTQDAPFISQGTGTDNNSAIVTVGVIAKQLEKQGNTVVVNQLVNSGDTEVSTINGHKYLTYINSVYSIVSSSGSAIALNNSSVDKIVDLTQFFGGNDKIPADLLTNPSHWSWYYNGSMAYNAGSLQNCNGRYLECGQGRQLFNPATVVSGLLAVDGTVSSASSYRTSDYILIVPNRTYYIERTNSSRIKFYDKNKQPLRTDAYDVSITGSAASTFTASANASYVRFTYENSSSIRNNTGLSLYYTSEVGGEGYNQHYPYVAPKRVDTGTEVLRSAGSVKDIKLPSSGLITRNVGILAGQTGSIGNTITLVGAKADTVNVVCSFGALSEWGTISGTTITLTKALSNETIYFELATPTTEQGTPFDEYVDINDYSYMAWFDTDGNLVSIPQGCKIQYPVNYKGFTDDLVMRTNGDATKIALTEEISDTALAERGYIKTVALSSDIFVDDTYLTVGYLYAYQQGNVVHLKAKLTVLTVPAQGVEAMSIGDAINQGLGVVIVSSGTAKADIIEIDNGGEFDFTNTTVGDEVYIDGTVILS